MQRAIKYLAYALLTAVIFTSCGDNVSLQRYYVDNQESKNFISQDLPLSLIELDKSNFTEAQKEAYNSVNKLYNSSLLYSFTNNYCPLVVNFLIANLKSVLTKLLIGFSAALKRKFVVINPVAKFTAPLIRSTFISGDEVTSCKVLLIKFKGFKLSEVKDFILLTSQLVEKTYDKVKMLIKIKEEKVSIEEFEELSDNEDIDDITFLIKIL